MSAYADMGHAESLKLVQAHMTNHGALNTLAWAASRKDWSEHNIAMIASALTTHLLLKRIDRLAKLTLAVDAEARSYKRKE